MANLQLFILLLKFTYPMARFTFCEINRPQLSKQLLALSCEIVRKKP